MSIPIEDRCKAKVWPAGEWHQHRCERRAVRDGFCKQHHPDAEKARAEKSRQRANEEWEKTPAHQLTIALARIAELKQLVTGLIATHEEMWETVTEDSCSRRCLKEWESLVAEAEREQP